MHAAIASFIGLLCLQLPAVDPTAVRIESTPSRPAAIVAPMPPPRFAPADMPNGVASPTAAKSSPVSPAGSPLRRSHSTSTRGSMTNDPIETRWEAPVTKASRLRSSATPANSTPGGVRLDNPFPPSNPQSRPANVPSNEESPADVASETAGNGASTLPDRNAVEVPRTEESPVEIATVEAASADTASADTVLADTAPVINVPADTVPADNATVDNVPTDTMSPGNVPSDTMSPDNVPEDSVPADTTTADGPVSDAEEGEVSAGTRVIHSQNAESPRFRAPFNDLRGTVAPPALPTAPLGPPRTLPADVSAPKTVPSSTMVATGNRGTVAAASPAARGLPAGNLSLISRVSYESDRPSATADLLVRHALTPPDDPSWQLGGQAWPLYSVLERQGEQGAERSSRLAVVRSYWRLTTDVAAYNWAVEEGAFVAGLQAAQPEMEMLALQAARTAAQARLQQARVAASAAQCELADLAGQGLRDPLPLPGELPLVGPYQTRFEALFANRAPPAGIRRIATTIPLRAELLQALAATVAADTDAIKELANFHREGRVPLEPVLAAHDRLQRHRGEFLDAVRIYNDQIAEYALAIAGTSNNQTVVAMLVRNPTIVRAAQAQRVNGMQAGGMQAGGMQAGGMSAGGVPAYAAPASGYSPNASPGNAGYSNPSYQNPGYATPGYSNPAVANPTAPSSGFPNSAAGYPANAGTTGGSATGSGYAPQGYAPMGNTPQASPPGATTPRTSSRGANWLSPAK